MRNTNQWNEWVDRQVLCADSRVQPEQGRAQDVERAARQVGGGAGRVPRPAVSCAKCHVVAPTAARAAPQSRPRRLVGTVLNCAPPLNTHQLLWFQVFVCTSQFNVVDNTAQARSSLSVSVLHNELFLCCHSESMHGIFQCIKHWSSDVSMCLCVSYQLYIEMTS